MLFQISSSKHDLRWDCKPNSLILSKMLHTLKHTQSHIVKLSDFQSLSITMRVRNKISKGLGYLYPWPTQVKQLQSYNINLLTITTIKLNQTLMTFNFELHLDFATLTLNFDLQCDLGYNWFCSQQLLLGTHLKMGPLRLVFT